jgi:ATP-dependent Clp protease ATP-binding subunit ClpA
MAPPPSLQDLIDTVRHDTQTDNALDQLVTAAAAVAQLEDTSDALLGHFVDRCRREGRSWSEISAALGVTKQAVHKRFASVADQIIAAVPSPTLERLTPRARNVLAAASRIAQASGQPQAGSAHLLLGLYSEPLGIAAAALQAMNVGQDSVEAAIRATPALAQTGGTGRADAEAGEPASAGGTGQAKPSEKKFTEDGRRAIRDALATALELAHNYIGTEHILLALFRNPAAPAAVILAEAGVTEEQARAQVTEMIRGYTQPPGV